MNINTTTAQYLTTTASLHNQVFVMGSTWDSLWFSNND